jgi:hypothetical protein
VAFPAKTVTSFITHHCTNDLDAMGRVCSALPGSMVSV